MSVVPLRAANPAVTIRVSGQLFQGHLTYLDQVVRSATECGLWAIVDLQHVVELDRAALFYLMRDEGHEFARSLARTSSSNGCAMKGKQPLPRMLTICRH